MTSLMTPARDWPLQNRMPLLSAFPDDGKDWLVDMTALPKFGIRGGGTTAWLAANGCPVPPSIDHAAFTADYAVQRLGTEEVVILPNPDAADALGQLRGKWMATEGKKGFDAYREEGWCWLALSGPCVPAALAELTAMDTRPTAFAHGRVAQTRGMHMDVVLMRNDRGGRPGLDILFDIASSSYAVDFFREMVPDINLGRLAV